MADSLAGIANGLPNGFHDAELKSLAVDWDRRSAIIVGEVWTAVEGPPEVYQPFRLVMSGVRTLVLPDRPELRNSNATWECSFPDMPSLDGVVGWPPDRPPSARTSQEIPVYSFFVFSWNDFITIQTERAELAWLGPAYERR